MRPKIRKQDIQQDLFSEKKSIEPPIILDNIAMLNKTAPPLENLAYPKLVIPANFKLNDKGLFYSDPQNNDELFLASKIQVVALVRDKSSENWGRLLEFYDADDHYHLWAMPMEMLSGNGEEIRRELLRQGLEIAPGYKARNLLLEYLISSKPIDRVRCVNSTGWHGSVYVLPEQVIGQSKERIVYQSEQIARNFKQNGSLEDWKTHISTLCCGNSRLITAIAIAFAAILLKIANVESGGLHFVGESSCGKTTALRVAASVFGSHDYLNRWRATTNGIEGLAAIHCDALLILDELSQVDPKEAGEIAYMLANGSGKSRANRNGTARSRSEWRLLFLSAGEIDLAQHMHVAGKKIKAGQEVRLVDIPADAGANNGIFENIYHFESGAAFSNYLQEVTNQYYGIPAITFLEHLTLPNNIEHLSTNIKKYIDQFILNYLPINASGQVRRVCERFALIAAAGEIATLYGITGWKQNDADQAASICFKSWLDKRGGFGNRERNDVLMQIKSFFEQHASSRFQDWDSPDTNIYNRVGFRRKQINGTFKYYVLTEAYKNQICAGLDHRYVSKVLIEEDWIEKDANGKNSKLETLPGIGRTRCYVFNNKLWDHA